MIGLARLLKCWWCRDKDYDENMVTVEVGKQKKRYHKHSCYDKYLEDKKFKEQEAEELDELVETIKDLHNIEQIPKQFYSYLQDIRNGNEFFGKVGNKKSKSGYPYHVISETYKQIKDSINWARNNREFKGTNNFLAYTKAIVTDKISFVADEVRMKKEQEDRSKQINQDIDYGFDGYQSKPVKKENTDEMDISKFL